MRSFGKVLPVDGYYVTFNGTVHANYLKSLTHLYQPFLGIEAIALYTTLLHEIDLQIKDSFQTHHALMNYLNKPLDIIYEARQKLEAIGLLKTYERALDGNRVYDYVLESPFAPEEFFEDAMMCELLYHHLGADKYQLLESRYKLIDETPKGKEVTATFNEVFTTFQPQNVEHYQVEPKDVVKGPVIERDLIDFAWLHESLSQRMVPATKVLTQNTKRIMNQMAALYNLETFEIEKCVQWALTDEFLLDITEFSAACADIFKEKSTAQNSPPPRNPNGVSTSEIPQQKQVTNHEPQSKNEMLLWQFETMSPRQILEDFSSGNQASEQDLKMIRDVMVAQGLAPPVMNVLIHYVLLQTNMQLSKPYLEKIASHWSRAKLMTAKDAMDFAIQEKERMTKQVKRRNQPSYRKSYKREVIPEWLQKQQKANETKDKKISNHTQAKPLSANEAKDQEEIAAVLDQLINNDKNKRVQG